MTNRETNQMFNEPAGKTQKGLFKIDDEDEDEGFNFSQQTSKAPS